jgi:predicted homoserine dehydrogenase-like protein
VVIEAPTDYAAACFAQYGLRTDASGRYAAMYKPFHLIGLELNVSVLSAALRGEATGAPTGFRADVVAVAKRDLRAGEVLDGEGGFTVYGRLLPADASLALGGLPLGLAHGVELTVDVPTGRPVRWADVRLKEERAAHRLRRELEQAGPEPAPAP